MDLSVPSILKFFLHPGAIAKTLFWCLISPVQQVPTKRLHLEANQRHLEAYSALPVKPSFAHFPNSGENCRLPLFRDKVRTSVGYLKKKKKLILSAKGSCYHRLLEAGALMFLQMIVQSPMSNDFSNKCAVQPGRSQARSAEDNPPPSSPRLHSRQNQRGIKYRPWTRVSSPAA